MKLLLIYPQIDEAISFNIAKKVLGIKSSAIPLALPTLAALTPEGIDVNVIDENLEAIDFDDNIDLVGISYNTPNSRRAYAIAEEFKKRNVTVVMGGIHASMMPEEALGHCDAVVVGEAENVWCSLLDDFKEDSLKPFYSPGEFIDLKTSPVPRWGLVKTRKYFYVPLQTSRGCPFDCEHCLDTKYYGRRIRHKPVEAVIQEIDIIHNYERMRPIMFADYNFLHNKSYAEQITTHLAKLNVRNWMIFGTIGIAGDDEILELLAKGGCSVINVGIESVSQESLDILGRKNYKARELKKLIEKTRSYGIDVYPGFMFGSDADKATIFEETVDFINETNILFPQINILQPYPGTKLYDRLKDENRLLYGEQWERYKRHDVSFKPKLMSAEQLKEGYNWTIKQLFSYPSIFARLSNLLRQGFYTRENFENQMPNLFVKGLSVAIPKVMPFFAHDYDLKEFLRKCSQSRFKPSLHIILVTKDYHDSYMKTLGMSF